jgi:hypothetical protein
VDFVLWLLDVQKLLLLLVDRQEESSSQMAMMKSASVCMLLCVARVCDFMGSCWQCAWMRGQNESGLVPSESSNKTESCFPGDAR